ncbi:MAG: hypothetical protein HC814_00350 [Rhodobacteraceae bacterium]|nr:hypothetical protein [Paracoccaceae bacterium]
MLSLTSSSQVRFSPNSTVTEPNAIERDRSELYGSGSPGVVEGARSVT